MGESFAILCSPAPSLGFALSHIQVFSLPAVPAAPTIEFEEAAYQVREPPGPEGVAVLSVPVVRRGDQNRTSRVRCSTRDGSAQAGLDYYPKSRMLKFSPGEEGACREGWRWGHDQGRSVCVRTPRRFGKGCFSHGVCCNFVTQKS